MHHVTPFAVVYLIINFHLLAAASARTPDALRYDVIEEQSVGTIIGNVRDSLRMSLPTSNVHFTLSPRSEYINIEPLTGLVRTSVVIDREVLCSTVFQGDCFLSPVNVVGKCIELVIIIYLIF